VGKGALTLGTKRPAHFWISGYFKQKIIIKIPLKFEFN